MKRPQNEWMKFTALALLGVLSSACSTTSPPTVDELVASNIAARGGAQRLESLSSIREGGTATASGGRVAQIVREIKRPGLFRLEFTYQGTTSVFAHDGSSGWQIAPLQGQFEPMAMPPEADAAAGVDQRDIEGPLVGWKQKGHVVTLEGRESIDGRDAYKLKVALQGGAVRYDYVDAATRLVVRSDFTRLIKGRPTMLQTAFSDFREVGGIVFPHVIETRAKDRPQALRIVVETIELDPALDDARFRLPQ
jgi:hypothetical protein